MNIFITYRNLKNKSELFYRFYIHKITNKNGQSLIEFLLLFTVIIGLASLFYQVFQGQIYSLWEQLIKMIVDDSTQRFKIGE